MGVRRRRWLRNFVSGLILVYLLELTLVATSNPIYVPSILLGAFLVPVTFVAYLYERLPSWDVPLQTLAVCSYRRAYCGVLDGPLERVVCHFLPAFAPNDTVVGASLEHLVVMSWPKHSHSPVRERTPDVPLDGVMQDTAYGLP